MALIVCPKCQGRVSDKAYACPHCGYPIQSPPPSINPPVPRKKRTRRANGIGSIVKLSGKRRKPFQVRVNTRIDDFGLPVYDILGIFPNRVSADIALAEYNKDPYDPANRKRTFMETFESWYLWKYKIPVTSKEKNSSIGKSFLLPFSLVGFLISIPHMIAAIPLTPSWTGQG